MNESEFRSYCEQVSDMMLKHKQLTIEGFMHEHAHFFDKVDPPAYDLPSKECFSNAACYAQSYGLLYAEGYADAIIPTHHAWCVDPWSWKVIDPTWYQHDHCEEATYFGVLLSHADLWRHISVTGYHSLFAGRPKDAHAILNHEVMLPFVTPD